MASLSVVISAFNEEAKIRDCLESVKWADEIIFVDNSSTDKTVDIAKKYTSKIFSRPNNLMLNVNKNYGFSKATGDWILCLDADEKVSAELKDEIKSVISDKQIISGYWIPRKNIIFGKYIQHTGWYPDKQLRLFQNRMGKFEEKHVHEMIKINGTSSDLNSHILHNHYETISQFLQKMSYIYVPNESQQLLKNGYKAKWQDAIRFPLNEFLSRFFARSGYKDGFHGLMLSFLMAFYHFVVFATIWEKQGFNNFEQKEMLVNTQKEIAHAQKQLNYWYLSEKIKTIKNPFIKIYLKMQRKLTKS